MNSSKTIQLNEFCNLLGARPREVRYILEQGFVPDGVHREPSTGYHRQFDPKQAFWLAMVVKLKESGVKTPLAADTADYAVRAVKMVAAGLNWDWKFVPSLGQFDTQHEYYVEVGDLKYVRLVTSACPSVAGLLELGWQVVEKRGKWGQASDVRPFVIIRLDLSRIAHSLHCDRRSEN